MKCRYIYDKEAGKVFIPGCDSAAIYGEHMCTCRRPKDSQEKETESMKIKELEKENARLSRIIKKLLKIK